MSVPPSANNPAVAYLRDSGHEDQELSTDQQHAVISRYAAENHIPVLRWFIDAASPGSSTIGRRQFLGMIDYLRAPNCPAKTLLIWSYSRFARDIDDAQYFKADLRRHGRHFRWLWMCQGARLSSTGSQNHGCLGVRDR
ncbi:MAG: recombinase family protein [Chloroflexi bacterium]|nr:recombinase family protein [Chloroflexota bacterium]HPA34418.1 recombinase family protein [Anaerolineaceae bacterium]HQO97992.1 recombinase family protein [Anaerolineaceae bacterium]